MNAPVDFKGLVGLPRPMLELIAQAVTGQPDGLYRIHYEAFKAVVADLEMLAQARINDEHNAVTETNEETYTQQLYTITRRAKACLALSRLLELADEQTPETP